MNIEELRAYCLNKKHSSESFPFDAETLVFKVLNKMFVIAPLDKWDSGEAIVTVKCDPDYTIKLREEYGSIFAGPYVSNRHWNTVAIHMGELSDDFVFQLIDHSFEMVVKGMAKNIRIENNL